MEDLGIYVRMILIWYVIWYDMIWYDMIWYDMIWYDMIYLPAIGLTPTGSSTVQYSTVQYTFTHKQYTEQHDSLIWKSADRVPSLRVMPWHLPCNWGKKHGKPSVRVAGLTFRHRASSVLGQAFRYSPENAYYIFNQQLYFIIWFLLDRASLI